MRKQQQQPQASSLAFHPQAQAQAQSEAEERERGAEAVLKEDEYKTIYASKLPDDCEEEELSDLFNKYGSVANISSIYQPRDKKDESKYAFVTFEDAEVARRIVHMSTIGRRPPLLRNNTSLYINWAKESLPVLQKAGNKNNNNSNEFDSNKAATTTTTARPMTRHSEEEGGEGGFAKTKAKVELSSDADGRNMVTYDDDFL
jgi:RNA recognition motif-containing protein